MYVQNAASFCRGDHLMRFGGRTPLDLTAQYYGENMVSKKIGLAAMERITMACT